MIHQPGSWSWELEKLGGWELEQEKLGGTLLEVEQENVQEQEKE